MRGCLLVVAACSPALGSNPIGVAVIGTPTLVAYRDGAGAWRAPDADGTLHVTDDYQLVVVCTDAAGFDTVVHARTAGDGDDVIYCDGHGFAGTGGVQITGHMVQAGTVGMYDTASSTVAPWDFTLEVPAGAYDLAAVGAGNIAIRRDISAAASAQLADLDLSREGAALVPTALVLDGAQPGDAITTEVDLYTPNNVAFGPIHNGATAQTIPASLLAPTDQVDLYVEDATLTTRRTADTWFTGTETHLALMPILDGIRFGAADAVTPGTLPPYTELELDLVAQTPTTYSAQRFAASRSWLAATGATELAFPALDAPRFQAAWTIDRTRPYTRALVVSDGSSGTVYSTAVVDNVNSSARVAGSFRGRPRSPGRSTGR